MNKDFLCALPDELILHILYFMNPHTVGQCRSVNKCLSRLAYDRGLLRKFPHYVLKEEIYFKEEAYHSDELFRELMRRDTNDMSWLVSRTNIILRECQMDSGSWALLTDASWIAAWKAACRTARNAAGDAGGDAAGHAAGTAAWYTDWYAARNAAMDATVDVARTSAWYAARDATRGAARDTTIEQIHALGTTIGQIHALGIKDSQSIGKKCYQIAECKSLLAINRD